VIDFSDLRILVMVIHRLVPKYILYAFRKFSHTISLHTTTPSRTCTSKITICMCIKKNPRNSSDCNFVCGISGHFLLILQQIHENYCIRTIVTVFCESVSETTVAGNTGNTHTVSMLCHKSCESEY